MKAKLILLFVTAITSCLSAQIIYNNEFLNIGVGVRSAGMGNAVVANTPDVTAGYWNAASLLKLESNIEVGYQHSDLFAGFCNYNYGGLGFKIDDNSSAGFSYIRTSVDDIPYDTILVSANMDTNYVVKTISDVDNAFLFHYARKTTLEPLSIGSTVKFMRRKVGQFANSVGFGLDISALYELEKIYLGVNLRDIIGTFNAWFINTDVFNLTGNVNSLEITVPQAVFACGYLHQFNEKFEVYSEIDLSTTFDGKRNTLIRSNFASIDPRIGVEGNYRKMVFLRLGINGFQKSSSIYGDEIWQSSPSIGVGLKFKKVAIDYALTNIRGSTGSYANSFSIIYGINKRK